jgi:hypothetical protein
MTFGKKMHIYVTTDDKFNSGFIKVIYNALWPILRISQNLWVLYT